MLHMCRLQAHLLHYCLLPLLKVGVCLKNVQWLEGQGICIKLGKNLFRHKEQGATTASVHRKHTAFSSWELMMLCVYLAHFFLSPNNNCLAILSVNSAWNFDLLCCCPVFLSQWCNHDLLNCPLSLVDHWWLYFEGI